MLLEQNNEFECQPGRIHVHNSSIIINVCSTIHAVEHHLVIYNIIHIIVVCKVCPFTAVFTTLQSIVHAYCSYI